MGTAGRGPDGHLERLTVTRAPAPGDGAVGSAGAADRAEQRTIERFEGTVPAGVDGVRRRTLQPHRVAVLLAVAGLLGLLLNAVPMERSAQTEPYGLRRSLSLGVLGPAAAVSRALLLDQPRAALDHIAGKDGGGGPAGGHVDSTDGSPEVAGGLAPRLPAAVPSPEAAPPPSPAALRGNRPPAAAPQSRPRRVPSAADPLRIWVGGDSVAGFFGFAMNDLAAASGIAASHSHYQTSTGLARPDYYDWPAHLAEDMRTYDPEVVVVMVGANDDQPLQAHDGRVVDVGSDAWRQEYARRAGALIDEVLKEGRLAVWVGEPAMRSSDLDRNVHLVDEIAASAAGARPGALYIDAGDVLDGPGGGYSAYLPDGSGGTEQVRAGDGVHLTMAGGRRLARACLDRVLTALAAAPDPGSASVGIG